MSAATAAERFDPSAFSAFRFTARTLDACGVVRLRYALDEAIEFEEVIELPVTAPLSDAQRERVGGLLGLLHLAAGVSYFKTALPARVRVEAGAVGPAAAALAEALYSEGLAELGYRNELPALPRPRFDAQGLGDPAPAAPDLGGEGWLIPVGGGKDSAVALELVRRAGRPLTLFSIGDAPPITRTAQAAGIPRLIATRRLDPGLAGLNRAGAINGHVPVTAIVSLTALLTAALHGRGGVAMANERSASAGSLRWEGVDVNHQFSKGLRCERLLAAAVDEVAAGLRYCSVLRPASELGIARAFARLPRYHRGFTSCNAVFRIDPQLRARSWCRDCPKCRFVFLALAPFLGPEALWAIFGADLLDDDAQYEGFAALTATGAHKPFECVGEEAESIAAMRLLAGQPAWGEHRVVARFVREVLPAIPAELGRPEDVLALHDDHEVPAELMGSVDALLGS